MGIFNREKYQRELHTTLIEALQMPDLLSRPFEKNNTQSHGFSIQDGTHQVAGLVSEDGLSWTM